ncbi:MAG TPA: hypothetical protein VFA87_06725, partial [Rhizomicrobium sp.]|nr:hypothetical protein [Rhizomicrobium sp.]
MRLSFPVLALLALFAMPALAQDQDQMQGLPPRAAPTVHVQVQQLAVVDATPKFDPQRATSAYLARVSGQARANSDAYFEGGYWLMLVDLLWLLAVSGLLLWLGIATAIRDWAGEKTHSRTAQAMIFGVAYVAIMAAAQFPLTVYEGYFREHAYGLSNQDFLAWLGDFGTGLALSLVAALILTPLLYGAIRRAREGWWLWGAGLVIAFQILTAVIFPVFIAPLFNHYSALPESPLKA